MSELIFFTLKLWVNSSLGKQRQHSKKEFYLIHYAIKKLHVQLHFDTLAS